VCDPVCASLICNNKDKDCIFMLTAYKALYWRLCNWLWGVCKRDIAGERVTQPLGFRLSWPIGNARIWYQFTVMWCRVISINGLSGDKIGTLRSVYQIVKATRHTLQKMISLGSDTWELDVPRITLFLRNTNQYNCLSYISLKIVPLWICTLLPATVKVGNIPESHFVRSFSAPSSHSPW
jgi:hypothetical protein